ncbi:Pentatricopeptide repeat [Macleaya cordata]|uniref:Pentatricopeptide repeat n=1 Tax=Macleaya cordata TaxID=56857 RepID=A0A200QSG7_MACCD|nr:Pentatricopeptide repeat [Macleaya cordata]
MCTAIRTPTWVSKRRFFEQTLSDLHKCSNLNHLKQIQAQIFKANLHQDPFVAPKLIQAFSLCRQMTLAVNVFSQIQEPNVHLYNTLMKAYAQNSQHSQAFSTFFEMQKNDLYPDNYTYPILLKACSGQFVLRQVQMIHTHIEKFGFYSDIYVPNSLIDTYSRCGKTGIDSAKKLFDSMTERDVVSWNSMIGGLVKLGELGQARKLFDEMPERDTVSWNTVLDGYVKAGEVNSAFELFQKMPERNVVSWSTMVSGYSKAGDMDMAKLLFDKMPVKNLVPWTIMISGYAEKGLAKEAFTLYDQMEKAGLQPDDGTFISILAACAESGLLSLGKRIHFKIERSKLRCSVKVCNALLDMYAKCGNLDKALTVFDGMVERDVVSWNSMLQGLALHGHGEKALDLFSRMIGEGVEPDGVTFVSVLCSCSHAGLLDEGRHYFSIIEKDYGIVPQVEHYGCMVDLLGRSGHLKEAFELIKSMPMEPNAIIWGTLLGACRLHNDVELAEDVVSRLVKLDTKDAGTYAILSNIYSAAGEWDNVSKVRLQMKSTSIQKPPGASSIELEDEVHEFTVADRSHPQSSRIYHMIDRLRQHLEQVGYVPRAHY